MGEVLEKPFSSPKAVTYNSTRRRCW